VGCTISLRRLQYIRRVTRRHHTEGGGGEGEGEGEEKEEEEEEEEEQQQQEGTSETEINISINVNKCSENSKKNTANYGKLNTSTSVLASVLYLYISCTCGSARLDCNSLSFGIGGLGEGQ
jgi:hypothetical protein